MSIIEQQKHHLSASDEVEISPCQSQRRGNDRMNVTGVVQQEHFFASFNFLNKRRHAYLRQGDNRSAMR